jgi:Flp pilus assembly protein TadD
MIITLLTKPLALFQQSPNNGFIERQWLWVGLIIGFVTIAGCTQGNIKNTVTTTTNPATMAALLAYASSASQDSESSYKSITSQTVEGDKAFTSKDYKQALKSYTIAVELAPSQSSAWFGLAASADMLGQFDLSDLAYKHLKTTHQKSPRYLNNLGYSHMLRGDLLVAREYFVKVFDLDPNNEQAQSNLDMLKHVVNNRPYNGQN